MDPDPAKYRTVEYLDFLMHDLKPVLWIRKKREKFRALYRTVFGISDPALFLIYFKI